jgi:hypothetical protein
MKPEYRVDTLNSMDRRESRVDEERDQDFKEEPPKPGPPWGFFLVLAAIVVVAIVYSVSIIVLRNVDDGLTPETVFGAMAACFTVIGTLVGTYFGLKAGLDGQEKVRHTLTRAANRSRPRPRDRTDANRDRRDTPDGQQGGARQDRDLRRGDREDREELAGRGV